MGSRDSERWSSLVRDQQFVYRPVCSHVYHSGNMFIFYIAGHEVRIFQLTLCVG